MAVENPDMRQLLAAQTEWHRAVAFDSQGAIIGATCQPSAAEITELAKSYDNRDATVGKGFTLCGDHFDVHRFHSELIYGRRGDSETGEGVALCRTTTASQKTVFVLITYNFPVLSARAVPQLVDFCKRYVAVL